MEYIIGVDGGATKTEAVAYSLDDTAIGRGLSGFGNLFLDFNKAAENIIAAIEQCINSIKQLDNDKRCLCIYLGLAGIDVEDNKEKIQSLIKEKFNCEVRGYHDSYLAHVAIHKGKDGIIIISGTGSVGYGVYKGRKEKCGGWGHIIGDEGSGYCIAIAAFIKMALEADTGMAQSELSENIMDKMNIKNVNDIVELTYSYSKSEIAAFAPIVVKLADVSEKNAVDILKQAGQNLAEMAIRLYGKLKINEPINIGIGGSILFKADIVRNEFISCLEKKLKQIFIINENISATKGACYLHRNLKYD
jgi:N-acetylglucosamine kinase-like BadF-type ATPase